MSNRVLALSTAIVDGVEMEVSTVDLGDIAPRGYETMIFVDSDQTHPLHQKLCGRYSTAEAAANGHAQVVAGLRQGRQP